MAITVAQAKAASEALRENEVEIVGRLERYIDQEIETRFDGNSDISVYTEEKLNPRMLKHLKSIYYKAGWNITETFPSANSCRLEFSIVRPAYDPRDR